MHVAKPGLLGLDAGHPVLSTPNPPHGLATQLSSWSPTTSSVGDGEARPRLIFLLVNQPCQLLVSGELC